MGVRQGSQESAAPHGWEEAQNYFVGVDLGQARDYTAIAIVQRVTAPAGPPRGEDGEAQATQTAYHLRHLERVELGTRYPVIITRVVDLLASGPLSRESPLVVDRTGVGLLLVS